MNKWLVIYESGYREIIEADNFGELAKKIDIFYVIVVCRMDADEH